MPELLNGQKAYAYVAVDECTRWRYAWAYPMLNKRRQRTFLGGSKRPVRSLFIQFKPIRALSLPFIARQGMRSDVSMHSHAGVEKTA